MHRYSDVRDELQRQAEPQRAAFAARFCKMGKGEYAEGDRFWGISSPSMRKTAKRFRDLPLPQVAKLLDDPIHECRSTALFILVDQFRRGDEARRGQIVKLYLRKLDRVNNWDLVDMSAYKILGPYLEDRDRAILDTLADSGELWRQRIAVIATFHFIRAGEFDDTLRLARTLISHEHDLIHKAVGWMLREIGNRDRPRLERFLRRRYKKMPRTMLRYAIERFEEPKRRAYLDGRV